MTLVNCVAQNVVSWIVNYNHVLAVRGACVGRLNTKLHKVSGD